MSEIRTVEIDGANWLVLADVLASVGRARAESNPMFVARIPSEERQQVKLDGRWTWLVTEFGADWAAGQDWREHGDPAAYGRDRAHGRAHEQHGPELYNSPVHVRIADEYRQKILSGQIAAAERLPRPEEAARLHSVRVGTIARAYRVLRDEGLVEARTGYRGGCYVRGGGQ